MLDKTYRPDIFEQRQYAIWEKSGYFAAGQNKSAQPYTIMMPPPNVTGILHMGHALTFTLQDLLVRFHRMIGDDVLWQPGTDHAGIATQMVVEHQLAQEKQTRFDLGREKFIERVWQWKEKSGGTITGQLRRLGASPDWLRERFTMDDGLSEAVRKVFVNLHKEGLIYRDKRLVNWDPKLHTAISDLEVESREIHGNMWYISYPVAGMEGRSITVATTRPETMMGDSAVAVHPDDERYNDLIGKNVLLPLVGRLIPIIADEYSDPEKGTGAVKITPAHDFNDFEVGRRHSLPIINIFDHDAHLNDNVPNEYRGLDRYDAREKIIQNLDDLGLLVKIEPHLLMMPYGDRSGVVVEPWLTDQWFVDAKTLAQPVIEAVRNGRTRFVPTHWENTFFEWMRNIQPWCISRQIWWGHRVPAWYGPDGHVFVEQTEEEAKIAASTHYGKSVPLVRDTDVLDTWFSSALWPFSTLGWPEKTPELERYYPTDVLVTGLDIIFFWVARMMMMGHHFMGDVPFRDVYIHALVRDEKGQKMSKSKGNVIDPLDLIGKYGSDALRFTMVALAAQGRDVRMAESRVEGYRNFATKIWNAARFAQMNECCFADSFSPVNVHSEVNRWIITAISQTGKDVAGAIKNYNFSKAASLLYSFVWDNFCDWYLEFSKPVFQGNDEKAKAETRAVMAWSLEHILHYLHPFMPFITEELWQETGENRKGLLATMNWPEINFSDNEAASEMEWVIRLISSIRAVRGEMNIPPSARIPFWGKGANDTTRARLKRHQAIISSMARLSSMDMSEELSAHGCLQLVVDEMTILLPVSDVIDFDSERNRLKKEATRLDDEIAKIDTKLANQNFLAKAKPEIIQEQRDRLDEFHLRRKKIMEALSMILGM